MQFALGFFLFFLLYLFCLSYSNLSIMVRKTRAHRTSSSSSAPSFDYEKFLSEKNQETYKKLNLLRFVWVERKVVLDELDPEIRRNFESRGWLPLMDINHPPPAILIREFYLNLSVHSNDSSTQCVKRPLLLGCLRSSILFILTISLLPLMTLCHILLRLLSNRVLILESFITC